MKVRSFIDEDFSAINDYFPTASVPAADGAGEEPPTARELPGVVTMSFGTTFVEVPRRPMTAAHPQRLVTLAK